MSADEFTIRVTGAVPPPPPTVKNKPKNGGRGRGKQQQCRYNLRLRPSSSLDELRKNVFALFSVPSNSVESYQLSFLGGFPPKELDPAGKRTVQELGIRPNESLIVKFSLLSSAGAKEEPATAAKKVYEKPNATNKPASESFSTSNTVGRPRRASAMAATASFRDAIAAQDEMLKKEKSTKKKAVVAIRGLGNANKRIATYNTGAAAAASQRPKKARMEGTGYRLDGKSLAGLPSEKASRGSNQTSQKPLFESKDDIAGTLLSSLNGGGQEGHIGKFLRMAMREALAKSYEASRAGVRVAAVAQGDFSFERVKGGSLVDGGGVVLGTASDHDGTFDAETLGRTLFTVSYSKMMEGRGKYEEQVEIIGLVALKGVLESVYNTPSGNDAYGESDEGGVNINGKEMLRPMSIAQMSPRVFWSLVYHNNDQSPSPPTVEDMLQSTMPNLDWTHLCRGGRKRQLSEKARENLRQEKQGAAQQMMESSSQKDEEGVKALEEMEESIMNSVMPVGGSEDHESNERERRARAAMARFGNTEAADTPPASLPVDEWTLVTPSEDDIDELLECITEAGCSEQEDQQSEHYSEGDAKNWASILLDSVRNWRELANCDAEYILSKLKQGTNANMFVPTSVTIQKWIDYAQSQSLEEIMLEIVDGDQDALELLQEKVKSSSPRDLCNWHSVPGRLLDVMTSGMEEPRKRWEKADVMRWTGRAKNALGVCPWLELFTASDILDP